MPFFKTGPLRFDILVMITYQMLLFYTAQQMLPIFLEYTPKGICEEVKNTTTNIVFENCYKVQSKCMKKSDELVCSQALSNSTCKEEFGHVYYESSQIEYHHACDLPGFTTTTAQYIGVVIGNLFIGMIADYYGRRVPIIGCFMFGLPALILSAQTKIWWLLYISRFIVGISIVGPMTVGWAYCSEIVSPSIRFKCRTFLNYGTARVFLTITAFLFPAWRDTTMACVCLLFIPLALVIFLPESPLFLEKKGRWKEAHEARCRIANFCGTEPPEYKEGTVEKTKGIMSVFKDSRLRKNMILLMVMWCSQGLVVYIIDLNGGDMTPNFWVGQFLSGLLLSCSRNLVGIIEPKFKWFGRRMMYILSQFSALLSCAALLVLLWTGYKTTYYYFVIYLVAFVTQSLVWEPCYLSAAELMPTEVRASTTALAVISSRVSTVLASQLILLKSVFEPSLFIIVLIIQFISLVYVYFHLQETRDCNLAAVGKNTEEKKRISMKLSVTPLSNVSKSSGKKNSESSMKSSRSLNSTGMSLKSKKKPKSINKNIEDSPMKPCALSSKLPSAEMSNGKTSSSRPVSEIDADQQKGILEAIKSAVHGSVTQAMAKTVTPIDNSTTTTQKSETPTVATPTRTTNNL